MKNITSLVLTSAFCGVLSFGFVQNSRGDLIVNGDFETTTGSASGQLGYNTVATGWSSTGYNVVFASGAADTTGALIPQYGTTLKLWGPGTGSANGLPASSPTGGNFLASDGASDVGALKQTITGLTVGSTYALSFYWAGAQQYGYTGATTEKWQVSLGSQTFSTMVESNVSHGFTGWQQQTFVYTATSASEVLSFLAVGTPSGVPPFSLLDGVSMVAVPEPTTIVAGALMIVPFGVSAARILRRKARA